MKGLVNVLDAFWELIPAATTAGFIASLIDEMVHDAASAAGTQSLERIGSGANARRWETPAGSSWVKGALKGEPLARAFKTDQTFSISP